MKNYTIILFFLLVFGTVSAFSDGKLTIDGLSDYNGKWVFASSNSMLDLNTNEIIPLLIMACEGFVDEEESLIGAVISGGKVTLNLWELYIWYDDFYDAHHDIAVYEGNDRGVEFLVVILNIPKLREDTLDDELANFFYGEKSAIIAGFGIVEKVNFTNGVGSGTYVIYDEDF